MKENYEDTSTATLLLPTSFYGMTSNNEKRALEMILKTPGVRFDILTKLHDIKQGNKHHKIIIIILQNCIFLMVHSKSSGVSKETTSRTNNRIRLRPERIEVQNVGYQIVYNTSYCKNISLEVQTNDKSCFSAHGAAVASYVCEIR